MGKKGGMPIYKSVDDYINNQPEKAQQILYELRELIQEAVPEAIELKDKKVPTFTLVDGTKPDIQLMIAGYAKFVSFYPFDAAVANFESELKGYEFGKGSIKFPFNKPLPKELIKKMVQFRREEIEKANN